MSKSPAKPYHYQPTEREAAMTNGRCRMHGGKSKGAPIGNRNAWKHGMYSGEKRDWLRALSNLLKAAQLQT